MEKTFFKELQTGWIAPNGDFYLCDYFEHIAVGRELLQQLYKIDTRLLSYLDTEKELINRGWCEVQQMHSDGMVKFLFNFEPDIHLTPEQIRAIKPVVEENESRIMRLSWWDLDEEFNR